MKESITELSEDMEVIGPGQMLREARESLNLTQQEIAKRLNLTMLLVDNIENERFDCQLPSTFVRGYLKNYARLVKVPEEDVLASYDLLGIAAKQQAEMQSFSRITEKQAENSRLMWITYLILVLLIGSTVVWWLQEYKRAEVATPITTQTTAAAVKEKPIKETTEAEVIIETAKLETPRDNTSNKVLTTPNTLNTVSKAKQTTSLIANQNLSGNAETLLEKAKTSSTASFTFSGDCWVNISDATGERVAWGIKKAGYVMNISGKAPFNVTLGKPELVSITFNGQPVSLAKFGTGNIAKFTLPLTP
jgi:cytoskeleton protein RodZ